MTNLGSKLCGYVTLYGKKYHELHQRFLTSWHETNKYGLGLIIGVNECSEVTMRAIASLSESCAVLDVGGNIGKYPRLKQALRLKLRPYLVSFDDDCILNEDWQDRLIGLEFEKYNVTAEINHSVCRNVYKRMAWELRPWYNNIAWKLRRHDKAVEFDQSIRGACMCLNVDWLSTYDWPDARNKNIADDELTALCYQQQTIINPVKHNYLCDMDNTPRRGLMNIDELSFKTANGY